MAIQVSWNWNSTIQSSSLLHHCVCVCSDKIIHLSNLPYAIHDFANIPGYIGEFEYVDDHRAGKIVIELNGRPINVGLLVPVLMLVSKRLKVGLQGFFLPNRL